MKALILRADAHASVATARALIDKGFQILSVDTLAVAHALIRIETVDLLVMDERVEGQLTHAIALSAERRNPYLSAIFLTDRTGEDTDDLYDLIPSLYALAGVTTAPVLLGQLALSAVSNVEEAAARVARNATLVQAELTVEDAGEADVAPLVLTPSELTSVEDDPEIDVPSYADAAIAAPAMAEIAATGAAAMRQDKQDAVAAEVAALFRKPALPHFLQAEHMGAAKAS